MKLNTEQKKKIRNVLNEQNEPGNLEEMVEVSLLLGNMFHIRHFQEIKKMIQKHN